MLSIFFLALPYVSVKFSCTHAPPPRLTPRYCFVLLGWEIPGEGTLKQSNKILMYNVPCGDDKKWRVNAATPVSPPINTVYCSSSHPLHSGLGLLTAFLICSNQKYVLDSHCLLLISLLKNKN